MRKRRKLFRQLLFNVAIPLAIGLMFLAYINYRINLNKLEENQIWQQQLVYKQVQDITELYDQGLLIYETHFDQRLKRLSEMILSNFEGSEEELMKVDPDQLRKQYNFDLKNEDFYVLDSNYRVVKTSFEKDKGLDFVKRNVEAKFFFDSIKKLNSCHVDRFSTEIITGNFRKYSYMPSKNKKIILELGLSSNEATAFKNERKKRVEKVKNLFPEILKINLFQAIYDAKHPELNAELRTFYNRAIKTKKSCQAIVENDGITHYHDFLFMPIRSSGMFHGYVVHIETDDSHQKKLIWNEVYNALILFLCTLLPIFIILIFRARSITKPIILLSKKSKIISEGNLSERIEISGNNEITDLSVNFNLMIEKLQESYENLEQKVKDRTAQVLKQKEIIEEKHKAIKDSINYAERIQRSFLASTKHLDEYLKNYFILYKPKDVVSGDFYWSANLSNGNFILATADSTGHGVPGAIMSLLNITSLEKAIENHSSPSEILNETRRIIIERLNNDGSHDGGNDGMDCSLCVYDFKNSMLHVAAGNNPVWIVRNSTLIEIKPDKMSVGKDSRSHIPFKLQAIQLMKGDMIYTLTDGFSDQFGGDKGKKFMIKSLRECLIQIALLPVNEQQQFLENTFINWKGDLEQVDDVTLIGVKF